MTYETKFADFIIKSYLKFCSSKKPQKTESLRKLVTLTMAPLKHSDRDLDHEILKRIIQIVHIFSLGIYCLG